MYGYLCMWEFNCFPTPYIFRARRCGKAERLGIGIFTGFALPSTCKLIVGSVQAVSNVDTGPGSVAPISVPCLVWTIPISFCMGEYEKTFVTRREYERIAALNAATVRYRRKCR